MITLDEPGARALRELMDRSVGSASVPPERLAREAAMNGRRLRTRRRAGIVVAAGALTTAAVLLTSQLGGPVPGATGRKLPVASDGASPAAVPFPELPRGWWDAPGDVLLDRLAARLPAGVEITGVPAKEIGYLLVTVTTADGSGSGQLNLALRRPPPSESYLRQLQDYADAHPDLVSYGPADRGGTGSAEKQIRCSEPDSVGECQELRDAEGRHYGRISRYSEGEVDVHTVTLQKGDGGEVTISMANSLQEKWGPPVSAEAPPLTPEQLRALAEDPAWTDWTPPADSAEGAAPFTLPTATPTPRGGSEVSDAEYHAAIRDTFAALLPDRFGDVVSKSEGARQRFETTGPQAMWFHLRVDGTLGRPVTCADMDGPCSDTEFGTGWRASAAREGDGGLLILDKGGLAAEVRFFPVGDGQVTLTTDEMLDLARTPAFRELVHVGVDHAATRPSRDTVADLDTGLSISVPPPTWPGD